jgi:hypothetical protein
MCVDVVNAAKRLSTPVVNAAQRNSTRRVKGIQRPKTSAPALSGLIIHLCHLIRRVCAIREEKTPGGVDIINGKPHNADRFIALPPNS